MSKWLYAMKLLGRPAAGVNAVLLGKLLKVTYKTAYAMLDKIRHCLSLLPPEKLSGEIQAGISVMGWTIDSGYELTEKQHPIAVGISLDENGEPDRLAMMVVPRTHMMNYSLKPSGRDLFRETHFSDDADTLSNTIYHSQLLTIKRCRSLVSIYKASYKQINGIYRGVHPRSLPKYLAEFTFRWNAAARNGNTGNCIGTSISTITATSSSSVPNTSSSNSTSSSTNTSSSKRTSVSSITSASISISRQIAQACMAYSLSHLAAA
ncbi:hypothetical protein [Cohnella sp. AR92]|uniref:hypothetical protein n=1 Tax=Cohnella sp. AR92 TaxID=648716 RepID=UPI001EDDEC7F|nr:hypothetical protein [Cohnella sp. AR92]